MGPNGTTASWIKRTFWVSIIVGIFAALPLLHQGTNAAGTQAGYAQESSANGGQILAKGE